MNGFTARFERRLIHGALALSLVIAFSACSREAKTAKALKRAEEYFQKGSYEEAKIEYANALRHDPKNAAALKNLGVIWMDQGAPLRALPYLLHVSHSDPGDLETQIRLAGAYLALDARADASNTAAAVLRDRPDNARALVLLADSARLPGEIRQVRERIEQFPDKTIAPYHLALGSALLKSGEIENGEAELQKAIRVDPKDPLPHMALANLAIFRKVPDEAKKHFQKASELASPRSLARISYAEFLLQSNQLQEARNAIKPLAVSAPDYLPVRRLDAQISFALGDKESALKQVREVLRQDPQNLEGAILQAQLWIADGDAAKATELLEQLNKKFPKLPVIRFELARCASAAGNLERSIQILDELVRSNPEYAQAVLVLNELRLRKGEANEAVSALETFCRERQTYRPAILLLAKCYRALNRYPEAVALYRGLLQFEDSRSDVNFLLGLTYREANQLSEAEQSFSEAAKADGKALPAVDQLVEIDLLRKDYTKASERVAARIKENSDSAELQLMKAKIEVAQEKWDLAEADLKRASEMNPALGGVYQLLIKTYLATGRLEDAGKQAELLCEQNPNDVRALTTAAVINGQLGKIEKSIAAYERLLAKVPDSTIALNNLACLYVDQPGQVDQAYAFARKAREQNPSDPAIADTLGWVCYKRKDYAQAVLLLRESSAQFPGSAEAMYHFGMASYAMGLWGQAADAFEKSTALAQQFPGKAEIAWRLTLLKNAETYSLEQLRELGKQHPDDVCVWHRLGEKLRDGGQPREAADAFEKAVEVNPQAFPPLIELAMLNAGPLQKLDVAGELLRKARAAAPGDSESKLALGQLAFRMNDWNGAYALLSEASRELKPEGSVPIELARSAYVLGKVSETTDLLARVAEKGNPNDRQEAGRLLTAMRLSNSLPDSSGASYIQEALAQTPDDPIILIAAGKDSQKRGDREGAAKHFDRALKLLPDSPLVQRELAGFYLDDSSKLAVAHDLALKARRSLPDDSRVMATLAETSAQRKEYAFARQLFEDSAKVEPLSARAQYYLGVCYSELKEPRPAAEALRRALAGDLADSFRADAQRLLKACESERSDNSNKPGS